MNITHEVIEIAGSTVVRVTMPGSPPTLYATVEGDCGGLFIGEIIESVEIAPDELNSHGLPKPTGMDPEHASKPCP